MTGGDDFLVHVAVPSVEALHAFLMDKFSKRREIVSFRSSVIYQHARATVVEAL
ncbi:Lrp/AsnC ligand binding domain-containing protein [Dactylosporangium sp. CS-047395]|uniref:Lrp/AsnC ligand binding domain-containing protein n=1 Tax=Dactylosporangium sp. CS-047395 TaxID=3239936 RepID=UPI003D8B9807